MMCFFVPHKHQREADDRVVIDIFLKTFYFRLANTLEGSTYTFALMD